MLWVSENLQHAFKGISMSITSNNNTKWQKRNGNASEQQFRIKQPIWDLTKAKNKNKTKK